MNAFMRAQLQTIMLNISTFEKQMELAARKDDGTISREEQKTLDKIRKANEAYIKQLNKIGRS